MSGTVHAGAMGFADAHLHPIDIADSGAYPDLGEAEILFGCVSSPSQWDAMSSLEDDRVRRFYGVHPWNASEWSADACARLKSILEMDGEAGIGEIGLDSKRAADGQADAFDAQLSLAERLGRPVNIHCVGCEREILGHLERHRRIPAVVMHAFSNESYAIPFVRLGCFLSVNPRILARSEVRVKRLMDSIPGDRLLLESDAPFAPRFSGMADFAGRLAKVIGSDAETLLGAALDNARSIA